jgi:hypothetical protein
MVMAMYVACYVGGGDGVDRVEYASNTISTSSLEGVLRRTGSYLPGANDGLLPQLVSHLKSPPFGPASELFSKNLAPISGHRDVRESKKIAHNTSLKRTSNRVPNNEGNTPLLGRREGDGAGRK